MSNSYSAIETARRHYIATLAASRRLGIDYEKELGKIWRVNVERFLRPLIESATSSEQIFGELNKRAFFDYTAPRKYIRPSYDWYREALGPDRFPIESALPDFCESALLPAERLEAVDGRLISTDFLNKSAIAWHLVDGGMIGERSTVLEIGAGYGALARLIKLLRPGIRYIIFDLPESLFFSEIFLRRSFPDASFTYCADPDTVGDLTSDFVLVPTQYRDLLRDRIAAKPIDLVVNTNSFGEMPLPISKAWLTWLESVHSVRRIYSLNRFLNSVDKRYFRGRRYAMGFNLSWGPAWQVEKWEVNPAYERCPYFTTLFTRNLHLLVSRSTADASANQPTDIERLKLQDWWQRPHWVNFTLADGGPQFSVHSKRAPELTPDLTKSGTAFALWESYRLRPTAESMQLLDTYMQYLSGPAFFFEEAAYLRLAHASAPPTEPAEAWRFVNPSGSAKAGSLKRVFRSLKRRLGRR